MHDVLYNASYFLQFQTPSPFLLFSTAKGYSISLGANTTTSCERIKNTNTAPSNIKITNKRRTEIIYSMKMTQQMNQNMNPIDIMIEW